MHRIDRFAEFDAARERKPFFIGVDSDGCAFDTMEIKHKECFIPNTIRHFGLQQVSRFAREAAEFVNLYSKWRGINRFPALLRTLDLLRDRQEVRERRADVPVLPTTRAWLVDEPSPGNPALKRAAKGADGTAAAELNRVLAWSCAVNASVAEMVTGLPPIPFVRECLARAVEHADIVVISATPGEALDREWNEHDLARYVAVIAGQELGTKSDQLRRATAGRYADGHVLMIGDAPGDLEAAQTNGARFFPIRPGSEATSWKQLLDDALERFLTGRYAGDYERERIADFKRLLPERPPWDC